MVVPTKAEIDKKAKDLEAHMKKLTPDGRIKETIAMSQVRSAIRQVWMRAPNKLAVLEEARVPDMNPATRTKWLFKCAICGKMFKQSDIEIDHIIGENKFTKPRDFESYWKNVLNVSIDGLQVLCAVAGGCHPTKTYQEKHGLTWQEAIDRKVIIKYGNLATNKQKDLLKNEGFKAKDISNQEKRDKCWTLLYEQGKIS